MKHEGNGHEDTGIRVIQVLEDANSVHAPRHMCEELGLAEDEFKDILRGVADKLAEHGELEGTKVEVAAGTWLPQEGRRRLPRSPCGLGPIFG
jgi:hypothetical protein